MQTRASVAGGGAAVWPSSPEAAAAVERRSSLIKIFATLGAISVTIGLTAQVRWIMSSDFTPSPTGPDPISDTRLALLRSFEFASFAVAIWVVWRFVLKPWIWERKLTLDGMIVIAGFLNWWMDPLTNYFNYTVAYNAHGIKMGSWMGHVPGVVSPESAPPPRIAARGLGSLDLVAVRRFSDRL